MSANTLFVFTTETGSPKTDRNIEYSVYLLVNVRPDDEVGGKKVREVIRQHLAKHSPGQVYDSATNPTVNAVLALSEDANFARLIRSLKRAGFRSSVLDQMVMVIGS